MSQPLKVLLIEDNRIEARQTQNWLDNAKDISFQVEFAYRMKVALDRLSRGGIDIILLDLNLPDSQGLETFLTLHDRAPHIPIVVLTGEDDESLGASAVAKGAQDYLIKHKVDGIRLAQVLRYALVRQQAGEGLIVEPKHGLARVLRYALDKQQTGEGQIVEPKHRKSAQVIGFLGAKGGVGTTTVALNVALALARQQKSVILAEMRPSFGTLACHLRQHPVKNLRTLLDDFTDHCNAHDLQALLCNGPAELRILFGPQPEDLFKEIEPDHAEAVIKGLATMADFVILDLPDQHSVTTQTAVCLCQFAIVVTEQALDSIACAKVALKQLQSWGVGSNRVGTVIVNRTENPSPIKPTEIGTRLGYEVVGVVPPGTSACFQTPEVGAAEVPTMADHVAASFVEIANRISDNRLVGMQL